MFITPDDHQEAVRYLENGSSFKNGTSHGIIKTDVFIIGSGAGGSAAAATLSGAGFSVVVAEEGPYRKADDFQTDEYRAMVSLFRDRGFINSEWMSTSILQGRVIGGSTTVNWQTSLYPDDAVTTRWAADFGLEGYKEAEMESYLQEVNRTLGIVTPPESLVNTNNDLLRKGARLLGMDYERIRNNNGHRCIGLGRCTMGCPIDAKQTAGVTFLPRAIEQGALVFSEMRAEKIFQGSNGYATVLSHTPADELTGRQIAENRFQYLKIESRYVVVCAGAIETPALLLRSGLGNQWVGRDLKLHPTASLLARHPRPVRSWDGAPQTIAVFGEKEPQLGHRYWLEAVPYGPTLLSLTSMFRGLQQSEWLKNADHFFAGIALVAEDPRQETRGRIEVTGAGQKKVFFDLRPEDAKQALKGIRTLARIQAASGAVEISLPFTRFSGPVPVTPDDDFSWILREKTSPYDMPLGSAHPHGSVRAAADPAFGALTPDLELYGHKNIYVMDASWFPTSLGVNPQVMVTAGALRASAALARKARQE